MLPWWIIFAVSAAVAAVFGYLGLASGAAGTAQVFIFIFILVCVLRAVARYLGRCRPIRIASNGGSVHKP